MRNFYITKIGVGILATSWMVLMFGLVMVIMSKSY